MYTQLTSNSFRCDLASAQEKFFQTVATLQKHKRTRTDIQRAYDALGEQLMQQWEELEQLAQEGKAEFIAVRLGRFLKEYAVRKALLQFLDPRASGLTLTPHTPGLAERLESKLKEKHQYCSSLLHAILATTAREREEERRLHAEDLTERRVELAQEAIEREFDRNRELHGLVLSTIGKLNEQAGNIPTVIREAHDDARTFMSTAQASLEMALKGVQQAQDVVPLIMDPMVKIATSLPETMQEAVQRATKRGHGTFFWVCLILGMGGAALLLVLSLGHTLP